MNTPEITVLIPAHNEAGVIHRSLSPLAELAAEGLVQVIVIANGCTDATVEVARACCPAAEVIELGAASKVIAMNAGAQRRTGHALVCLDADITLPDDALFALVMPLLEGRAELACGRMVPELGKSNWIVRAFYRGWALNPYFDKGKAGGVVALSDTLARRAFPLPDVTSDDEMIARLADADRRAFVPEAAFKVFAPRTLRALIAIRKRSRRGTAALERAGFSTRRATNTAGFRTVLGRALRCPARLPDVVVYGAVIAWVRLMLACQGEAAGAPWERDQSSREHA